MMMRLPARGDGPVTILIQETGAPHIFARSQLALDRSTAEIVRWEPYSAASAGRKVRIWVRGLHTGEALDLPGQTVAGLASLGGCFLVWTGLAMAWRRFRYRKREVTTPDALIPALAQPISTSTQSVIATAQTITEGKRIKMEQTSPALTNGHSHHRHSDPANVWTSRGDDADSVLMLYGSMTGTAEALAHKLAGFFRTAGLNVGVRDMAHCQPDVLRQAKYVLMIVSTYGDGEPPDDVVPFWKAIVQGDSLDLRGIGYSVLALGNTTFDQFCKCGRDFDAALERHGATRIFPRVDCDVDYDAPAAHWLGGVFAHLMEHKRSALSA
jgi:sulfite reductase (NADPH) flavoprotein alpha-component